MDSENHLNSARISRYKLRRRALAVAPSWPAEMLCCHARRQSRAGGRRTNGGHPAEVDCPRPAALGAALASARRARPVRSAATSVSQEILRSASIGVVASLALVWLTGGSPLGLLAAVIWSSCFGALIGILLWVGSVEAPEDPVLPPSPEQLRGEKPPKPSRRR